ncbi:hypothetical protein CPB85DRAFT_1434667 [Mucidula mucida]|nr:hypothetical protein CPB85DRAFT_1434667 [Mucidula mucida]
MSAMAESVVHVVVNNTMGAAFIGVIIAACLYGVSCVQTWYYYNQYQEDAWYIKFLVGTVWFFDTIHQALISHTVYWYVVSNFYNTDQQNRLVSILLEVLFNGFIGLLVQAFLTFRVWRLSSRNVTLTVVSGALALATFGCSAAFTIESLRLETWNDLVHLRGLSMSVNILGAAADVFIAACLFYYLRRSRTGFKRSDTMISKLILFSVSTGLMTSVCAIASLISILAWSTTLIYVAFYFSLGRLYSNSVLATLNARRDIRGISDDDTGDMTLSLNTFKTGRPQFANAPRQTNISIKIDTTKELVRDGEGTDSAVTEKSERAYPSNELQHDIESISLNH